MVGGGGREHALVRALARSPQAPDLLCAPGNPGIAADARILDVTVSDLEGLVVAARQRAVDLVVVGPEGPLVGGLVVGLSSKLVGGYISTAAEHAIAFALLMAMLALRPQGLFGRPEVNKA